jgi:GntR family transcriptional regulator/MocR family aminotransferase
MSIFISLERYVERYSTKYAVLYHALRDAMMEGKLAYGDRLPSSRELARVYGFSRGTVANVLEVLAAEGYVAPVAGSGTYVSFRPAHAPAVSSSKRKVCLSEWGLRLASSAEGVQDTVDRIRPEKSHDNLANGGPKNVSFRIGIPDMSLFPKEAWNRCLYEAARTMTEKVRVDAHKPLGVQALREAIAKHLQRSRGIVADAERIAIVNGSMQAIALLAQLLAGPSDAVVAEHPGYRGFREAVLASGAKLIEGEVDEQGLRPQPWDAKLLFVTPNRQFPTGAVLSMERRQQLLLWAAERESFIVEDEYDSEFRHRGKPIETLKSLDAAADLVLYTGTFSKTMMTELRLGFVVLPAVLVEPFARAKALYEPYPCAILEQRALAAFMNSGLYERHLRRMKRVYSHKFALLRGALTRLPAPVRWVEGDAGLHIFGWWKGTREHYVAYEMACREAGVEWVRDCSTLDTIGISLGFSHLTDGDLIDGIETMIKIWENMDKA